MNLINSFRGLIKYRWLLEQLISRDLKNKYRKSVLGYLWSVLNPLLMMAILTVVFSTLFRFDVPNYAVYILSGQLIYNFFSESTSMAMGSILNGASLIKKVYLPKYVFPLSRVLSSFTTMLFSLLALFVVMYWTNVKFTFVLLLLPLPLIYILLFSIGVGLIMSVAVVYFRDMEHLYSVFLSAYMYLTPIIYPLKIAPKELQVMMRFNPMYHYIEMFRDITMYNKIPSIEMHAICLAFSLITLLLGIVIFRKYQKNFILYI